MTSRARNTTVFFLIALVLVMTSCEDRTFFMSDQRGSDPTLMEASIREGEILLPEEEIEVELADDVEERTGETPRLLRIEILDSSGESLGVRELEEEELAPPLPVIDIEPSGSGVHTMVLTLLGDAETVISEKRIRFFSGDRYPAIDLLETYPPEAIPPDGKGIIVPKISGTSEGWLRWSSGGEVLDSGPYEKYRSGFLWSAPRETGVYSIRLDLYPAPPPESMGKRYPFSSPVASEVQFFVSSGTSNVQRDLRPAESYRHLLHFSGDVSDAGYEPADFAFTSEPPPVVIREGIFGYRFSSDTALEGSTSFLPAGEAGSIAPATITFRYLSQGNRQGSRLLRVEDAGGSPYFLLAFDEAGVPYVSMGGLGTQRLAPEEYPEEEIREITVSLVPRDSGLEIRWYHNGRHVATTGSPVLPEEPPQEAVTLIGGSGNGFRGVLYELGLYTRNGRGEPSADPEVFRRYVEKRHGEEAIFFADGYEDAEYTVETDSGQKQVFADSLWIPGGGKQELLSLEEEWQRLELDLELSGAFGEGRYIYLDFTGGLRVTLHPDGRVAYSDGRQSPEELLDLSERDDRVVFSLVKKSGGIRLDGAGGTSVELRTDGAAPSALGFGVRTIDGGEEPETAELESLLVLRAPDKLAEKEEKNKNKIES
jgi:hypothetical protein